MDARLKLTDSLFKNDSENTVYIKDKNGKKFLNIMVAIDSEKIPKKPSDKVDLQKEKENYRDVKFDADLFPSKGAGKIEIRKKNLKNSDKSCFLNLTLKVSLKVPHTGGE